MLRLLACVVIGGLALYLRTAPEARAEKKTKVLVLMTWKGSVDDDKLPKPECIATAKGLEKIWKEWKIKGNAPKLDFSKLLVVATYSPGSSLNLAGATLDEKGNLEVLGFGTADFRPGFRYVLGTVRKEGVVTVNGKKLPKD
jgi:hypothetical protein